MVTMPHRLSRSETSARLLIATLFVARPAMTRRDLAAFFHVSLRTVIDAVRHLVARWIDLLVTTPEPSNPGRIILFASNQRNLTPLPQTYCFSFRCNEPSARAPIRYAKASSRDSMS